MCQHCAGFGAATDSSAIYVWARAVSVQWPFVFTPEQRMAMPAEAAGRGRHAGAAGRRQM